MTTLYVGIRIPNKTNEFFELNEINLDENVSYLKDQIAEKIDHPKDKIELIYHGTVLKDLEVLNKISPNSTIHAFQKTTKYEHYKSDKVYTTEDYLRIANIFGTLNRAQLTVVVRINILQKIIGEYPEFRRNLGAQAFIRDSILFQTLGKPEVIEKISKHYGIICDAAEFIVKTTKSELLKNELSINDEYFSDATTSSEEESASTSTGNPSERDRNGAISRRNLAAALLEAGSSSVNSLSNIAQRNAAASTDNSDPAIQASSAAGNGGITYSVFSNALARAFDSIASGNPPASTEAETANPEEVQTMDTSEPQDPNDTLPGMYRNNRYANELRTMRQMGLTNDAGNVRILTLTNGDLATAINLVLGAPDLSNDLA